MAIFDPVTISWGGRDYTIPPDQVMRAIARVEDVLTLAEISRAMAAGNPPLAKISSAFGCLLRFAGATHVTDDEVYASIFAGTEKETTNTVLHALATLSALMLPPEHLRKQLSGKIQAGSRSSRAGASSKSATSSRRSTGK